MSYKLEKPYTDKERADFVCEHQGLNYYEDDNCIIMYLDSESVADGVVTDISQTPEYIAEQKAKNNAIIKQDILKQLSEIDAKTIRALREGNATYITRYEVQAQVLREQLNATM